MPATGMMYVAMRYNAWDAVEALTPAPQKVGPMGKSCGFILAYHSLEDLRTDWPDIGDDWVAIEPRDLKKINKPKAR
jgi:hypothetical protein